MIWKHLGFRRNIFFVEPLLPREDDIRLFVGRDEEIKKYLADVLSDNRSLKIVSGDVGVGKTTFVNACQYFSYTQSLPFNFNFDIPKILPCFEKIQIRESDNIDDFFHQAITSICQSIVHHSKLKRIEPPSEVQKILSYFLELSIGTGGSGLSIGASALGTGLQYGKTKQSEIPNPIRNARVHLKKLVELAKNKLGFQGVFVIVNNLDILSKNKLIEFVNTARDELFDIPGIYWTLIGRKGIGSVIETEADRVADYLSGIESYIGALDFKKTMQIINKRVETYRESKNIKCPLTDDTIQSIYFLSVQELRETLRICGEITKTVLLINPSYDVIPNDIAMKAFVRYAHDRAKDIELSESKIRVLKSVFERESCRPKDFEKFGYDTVQGFIAALKGLVGKRLLSVEERGTARIYSITGMTMIAALTGALGNEIQDATMENLRNLNGAINSHRDKNTSPQLELQFEKNDDI